MSTWRIAARGWRVFVPVVLVNAFVQAGTVAPTLTPGSGVGFVLLAVLSFASLSAALAAVAWAARATAIGGEMGWPRWWTWAAAAVVVLAVSASALLSPIAVPFVAVLALALIPGIAADERRVLAGARVFGRRPLRAVLLALGSLVAIALLWVIGLLLGFFVTGAVAAVATWLVYGAVGVVLICAWTVLYRADPSQPARARHAQHGSR